MAEVAANIESKVSIEEYRIAMDEKNARLQDKVSFEDMKRYMALNGAGASLGGDGAGNAGGPMANRQFELIDEEMRRLKEKVEDTFHQVQSLR